MSEAEKNGAAQPAAGAPDPGIILCSEAELTRVGQILVGASLISGYQPSAGTQVAYGQNMIVTGIFNMTADPEEQRRIFRHVMLGLNQYFLTNQKQVAEVKALVEAPPPPADRVN